MFVVIGTSTITAPTTYARRGKRPCWRRAFALQAAGFSNQPANGLLLKLLLHLAVRWPLSALIGFPGIDIAIDSNGQGIHGIHIHQLVCLGHGRDQRIFHGVA